MSYALATLRFFVKVSCIIMQKVVLLFHSKNENVFMSLLSGQENEVDLSMYKICIVIA